MTTILAELDFDVKTPKRGKRSKTAIQPTSNKLSLTSGEHVKAKRFKRQVQERPQPVLNIGKYISLELTLAQFGIEPNRETLRRIGGTK